MSMQIVLDTDVVIHLLRKQALAVERFLGLVDQSAEFLLSPVVVAEIYAGAFVREHKQIETLFAMFREADVDGAIARRAGHYANKFRKAYQGISPEDYLLAATAHEYSCSLWTGNRKHYPMDDIQLVG